MKGKGKSMADKDCPLQFPDLKPVDHIQHCVRYSSVLEDDEKDSIRVEDLDVLQTDLETLLAAAGKRLKLLESDLQILVNWQEKKDKKGGKVQPESNLPCKRGKQASEEKQTKKMKVSAEKGSAVPQPPGRPPKTKNVQRSLPSLGKPAENDFPEHMPELPKLPKNDAVDRFWASVEPYCADITNDDVKLVEELLKSHEDDCDYFRIPPLGRHYSERWAQEDLLEEQKEGAKITDKRRSHNNNTSLSANDAANMLKKAEASYNEDSPFGPLTQRLVSALIEENVMTAFDDSMTEINPESVEEACSMSPRALAKQLNIGNPALLEKRIKRELEEQGILESEDKVEDNPDDEILTELKQKQQELRAVCQHNIPVTKNLLKQAKEEMARQELRKKLTAVEAEVMEAYRKIQASKQKKKTPTKKEKDAALRALKERETLFKTLEG